MRPRVSVVIRAKDEAANIGRTLELLHGQTVPEDEVEIIVVDSGSRDATADIARAAGARVIAIPASSFTYGGALNTGAQAAAADRIVALSAHAYPPDDGWLERMIEALDDDRVACASGQDGGPDGGPLLAPITMDRTFARRWPLYGYSSAAGCFRASLWRQRPFRPEMPGTEDKEWAWHWIEAGRTVIIDPRLRVLHDHSKDSARELYRRAHREWLGFGMYLDLPRRRLRDVARVWWTDQETYRNSARARLSHRRAARLVGEWMGQRAAERGRAPVRP